MSRWSTRHVSQSVTVVHVSQVLRDAKIDKSEVNEVVLVGGSTRIPKVQQIPAPSLFGSCGRLDYFAARDTFLIWQRTAPS